MFGQLPTLFERNYIIGYFLPVTAFIAANLGLTALFLTPKAVSRISLLSFGQEGVLVSTAVLILMAAFGGVILLSVNQDILALMQGYGRFNPARVVGWKELRRYKRLVDEKSALEHAYRQTDDVHEKDRFITRLGDIDLELAENYPDQEEFVLPTRFGNVVRAWEVYGRAMYGLELPAGGWNRLLAVIPKEYRDLIDAAKAYTDFWVNLWALGLLFALEGIGYVVYLSGSYLDALKALWLPLLAVLLALIASIRARHAAREWGDIVKASFDVFLPDLGKKMGLPAAPTLDDERDLWMLFSHVIMRRSERARRLLDQRISQLLENDTQGISTASQGLQGHTDTGPPPKGD